MVLQLKGLDGAVEVPGATVVGVVVRAVRCADRERDFMVQMFVPHLGMVVCVHIPMKYLRPLSPTELDAARVVYAPLPHTGPDVIDTAADLANCLRTSTVLHSRALVCALTTARPGASGDSAALAVLADQPAALTRAVQLLWATAHNRRVLATSDAERRAAQQDMARVRGMVAAVATNTATVSALAVVAGVAMRHHASQGEPQPVPTTTTTIVSDCEVLSGSPLFGVWLLGVLEAVPLVLPPAQRLLPAS